MLSKDIKEKLIGDQSGQEKFFFYKKKFL